MALKTYTAKAELIEGLKVRASARDFSIVLDEPLEQGGTNAGMKARYPEDPFQVHD